MLTATRTDKLKPEERRFVPCQVLTSNRELAANCFQSARETQTDDERVMYLTWRKHRVETARCQFAYRRRHSLEPPQATVHATLLLISAGVGALSFFWLAAFCQMLTLTAVVRACAQFANRRSSLRELRDARRPIHRHADVTRIVELCLQTRPGAV